MQEGVDGSEAPVEGECGSRTFGDGFCGGAWLRAGFLAFEALLKEYARQDRSMEKEKLSSWEWSVAPSQRSTRLTLIHPRHTPNATYYMVYASFHFFLPWHLAAS